MGVENRRQKSLRNGVHHANAVVWGPVYRTHLSVDDDDDDASSRRSARVVVVVVVVRLGLDARRDGDGDGDGDGDDDGDGARCRGDARWGAMDAVIESAAPRPSGLSSAPPSIRPRQQNCIRFKLKAHTNDLFVLVHVRETRVHASHVDEWSLCCTEEAPFRSFRVLRYPTTQRRAARLAATMPPREGAAAAARSLTWLTSPSRSRDAALALAAATLWGCVLYLALGASAAPRGAVFAVFVLYVAAAALGRLCALFPPTPPLLGHLGAFYLTPVPVRPRWRGERRSILKDFSRRISPATPRFQSRHTSTPFNST